MYGTVIFNVSTPLLSLAWLILHIKMTFRVASMQKLTWSEVLYNLSVSVIKGFQVFIDIIPEVHK